MKQGSKRYALTKQQQSIYYSLPLTWQERKHQEAKDRFYRKMANYCFAVEMVIIVALLWLVVPNVIEGAF